MSDGFSIDIEQVREGASRYREVSENYGLIADYTEDTDGDTSFFGVIGEPLLGAYYESSEKVREIMRNLGDAGAGLGDLIDSACATVEATDEESANAMSEIIGELLE
ncbi:type VII secretion target [Salininema proteolyticum]|uniref:Type VII secretion target n=1 Tax=Salininema proteolyticum TaxID=1607685 RepID=A0ABV8TVH6_9ACTN